MDSKITETEAAVEANSNVGISAEEPLDNDIGEYRGSGLLGRIALLVGGKALLIWQFWFHCRSFPLAVLGAYRSVDLSASVFLSGCSGWDVVSERSL